MSDSLAAGRARWLEEQEVRYATLKHQLRQAFDPWGLAGIHAKAAASWLCSPVELASALTRYGHDVATLQQQTLARFLGAPDSDVFPPNPEDQRFADPVWRDDPRWDFVKEAYLMQTRWIQDMLYRSPGLTEAERRKSAFWLRQSLNALAPTNFLATNPVAQRRAAETGGASLAQGLRNLAGDLKQGEVSMTDTAPFTVGGNLALTPGSVVYRNRLLEVIHYAPATDTVHAMPLVLITPWINKYYILDLAPGKSMVEYLVGQGFNVFVTSWNNPGADDAGLSFDDYLVDGAARAIEVAQSVGRSEQVHALGYCIGGTLLALYMAWANRRDPAKVPVAHWTLLTALTDFSEPGDIEVFIDEDGLAVIDGLMEKQGYLDGGQMAASFRMLRPNSLIWNYVVSNYLMGETPRAMDVLFWNTDATRMPAAMHRFYLREFYLNNRMVQPDSLTLAGQPIDLGRITQPLFMVAAEEDHIAPWKSTFKLVERVRGPVRFTLSTSGHILGMVNPPSPASRRSFWQGEAGRGERPEVWLAAQHKTPGSWWPGWAAWLAERCGPRVNPPPMSNRQYRKLGDAPGTYVFR
ncbi:PHA/PHB synthase family protein [Chitinimonas koreensis]|uniref:PHA/PHB synthase family protein n=1 Tax=Chitinimonas koreensis TaxID=356302 RepID=UPI00040CB694|nr:alpha/beta fold hydrolase [Chitinimonas koreensis]QNM96658.1 alpha/beta fold hydrolase [Chitinimonas koreensis]